MQPLLKVFLAVLIGTTIFSSCSRTIPFPPSVPLNPYSPWPKFRANAMQDGRSSIRPAKSGGVLWTFQTGQGIFSSPVIGPDGTIFVGSADNIFYAINPDGTLKWKLQTNGIIDSSALLDNKGRVYFGSGDGRLYALNAGSGQTVWTYLADDPSINSAYIRWFEGNVAIGPNGNLYVPNGNFFIYCIDRDTGKPIWKLKMNDQTWSLPAVDPSTGMLYGGNNNMLSLYGKNLYGINANGKLQWSDFVNGTVAASPLLTSNGKMVVGAFDGFVYAFNIRAGDRLWNFGTRDHIYSSPALLPDGTIIQPSTDGTVYALNPLDGKEVWAFDTLMPIRSSPAIDADGNIYVGSGGGKLFVLNPNGTLRWSMQLIDSERNDLNSSPALGRNAIYIGGENGGVFSVPYDYCLRPEAANDVSCTIGSSGQKKEEGLPSNGAFLYYTSNLGNVMANPPTTINANQPMAFSLFVRKNDQTQTAVIDANNITATVSPNVSMTVNISGDRKFVTIAPIDEFIPDPDGLIHLSINGNYLGEIGGAFSSAFTFTVLISGTTSFPMQTPNAPGDPAGVWEMYRLAAPLPSILTSYNQIGFDSYHFLIGIVGTSTTGWTGWVAGAMLSEETHQTVIDPNTKVLYPVEIDFNNGLLTMKNKNGMSFEIYRVQIKFDSFEIATRVDSDGIPYYIPQVLVTTNCNNIKFYGQFLKELGFCNPQTDLLTVFGAALLRPYNGGSQTAPSGIGSVSFTTTSGHVTANITDSQLPLSMHSFGILLIDPATRLPISLDYGTKTERSADLSGNISSVELTFDPGTIPSTQAIAYLMVDTYPAAQSSILSLN